MCLTLQQRGYNHKSETILIRLSFLWFAFLNCISLCRFWSTVFKCLFFPAHCCQQFTLPLQIKFSGDYEDFLKADVDENVLVIMNHQTNGKVDQSIRVLYFRFDLISPISSFCMFLFYCVQNLRSPLSILCVIFEGRPACDYKLCDEINSIGM